MLRRAILFISLCIGVSGGIAEASCTGTSPSWSCPTWASAQTLFNASPIQIQQGDIVTLTASETVTAPLHLNEAFYSAGPYVPGFTLTCAPGVTITVGSGYVDGTPGGLLVIGMYDSTKTGYRVTGCTFDAANQAAAPGSGLLVGFGSALDQFRFDNNTFNNMNVRAITVNGNRSFTMTTEFSGLADHNTCNTASGSSVQCFTTYGYANTAIEDVLPFAKHLGSNHAVYFEKNTCNFVGNQDGCTDAGAGANMVARFNTTNMDFGVHGSDSNGRGMNLLEVYRNTMSNPPANRNFFNARSGPDVFFDNTATGANWQTFEFTLYRTMQPWGTLRGKCDGTSNWDANQGTGTAAANGVAPTGDPGWGCLDQTGWYFGGSSTNPPGSIAVKAPAYLWNNTVGGVSTSYGNNDQPGGSGCNASTGSCGTYSTNYITSNRDYYTDNGASCTAGGACTTGIGIGTTLPTSCTVGVGFWKTNEGNWNVSNDGTGNGVLYKCTSTNTWTLSYTPYTYPHPLQSSGGGGGGGSSPPAFTHPSMFSIHH